MPKDLPPTDEQQEAWLAAFPPVSTEAWQHKIQEDLKEADYDQRLVWRPPEGFAVQPFYRAEDLHTLSPGLLQATRRKKAVHNDWHIRQDVALADVTAANRRAREALEHGATTVGFLLSSLPISKQTDLERLLDGLPLDVTPIHFVDAPEARPLLAMLFNEAARGGVALASLQGSITTDPLKRLVGHGRLDVDGALDEAARFIAEVEASGAALHALCVDAQVFHEAGASAVQELAFALAAASEYIAQMAKRGVSVAQTAWRLRFCVPVGTSYFMEIAKLRAVRVLFAHLARAYADEDAPMTPYVEAVTSRRSLSSDDSEINMLRATTQAAAAVIGGCDELTLRPFDAASGPPSDFAFRIARNVQLILKEEAHLDAVVDPAAGSYYIETLTDQLARQAWLLFQRVEARGGLIEALRQDFIQQEIQAVRQQRE